MSDSYVLGLDLGGTKIAAAVFDEQHRRITDVYALPTMANQPAKLTLLNLKRALGQAIRAAELDGPLLALGMGSPGRLDESTGSIVANNLPHLQNFPLARFLSEKFRAPLFWENDANCFTLAEALVGAGAGHTSVVGLTLGTGFGCGLVVNSQLYHGNTGAVGELSHCRIAGGSFDEMLSGDGVRRFYERVIAGMGNISLPASQISKIADSTPSTKKIGGMAENGDPAAVKAWALFGQALGEAIGIIVSVIDPAICVIGGSVATRFDLFHPTLKLALDSSVRSSATGGPRIEPSHLKNAAGVVGAAEHAFVRLANQRCADSPL
jgi:glucokinase